MSSADKWPRNRPVLSVTLPPELKERVRVLTEKLPGATTSAVVEEVLEIGLPMLEQMADAMIEARRSDGSMDEAQARDALAQWAGAQILGLYDKSEESEKGGEAP